MLKQDVQNEKASVIHIRLKYPPITTCLAQWKPVYDSKNRIKKRFITKEYLQDSNIQHKSLMHHKISWDEFKTDDN